MSRPQPQQPQWVPTDTDIAEAKVTAFARFVERRHAVTPTDYTALWKWSVEYPGDFWQAVWDWFDVRSTTDPGPALADDSMPGAVWFPGARLNYAGHVLRNLPRERPALVYLDEEGRRTETSGAELARQTGAFAATLRSHGVGPGDSVVGYLPNIPEAVVALLATASLGATWAACGQDYAARAALDRLGQLEPKVLVTADGYRYAGTDHARTEQVTWLREHMPTLALTVVVTHTGAREHDSVVTPADPGAATWADATAGEHALVPVPVPFDHPLWVVFSSGTTGPPKGIVHGHGGVLLEHAKALSLQLDIGPDDIFFWYTSPSWMMWNFLVAGLVVGATVVCYDGAPSHPDADRLWRITAQEHVTVFGTSPGYVLACAKAGVVPRRDHDLSALRAVGVTGSTLPSSSSLWLAEKVGDRVQVMSITGGTDVVSAFIGSARTVPVWPGELSVPCLGVAVDAFDAEGRPVRGDVGELVVTAPMPSMPVRFWNDPDGTRYRDAYFSVYPGVWRHGDWISITERGTVEMHGRSDSTLNRHGIRMGSADIYQVVEKMPEIVEALVLGVERPDGGYWMPLFVVLADGVVLDDTLRERIGTAIREELSPRHVPDDIIAAPGVPHTRTGKKLEVPIKRILQGADIVRAVDRNAIDAPELVDWYRDRG
ncbi:acetoacetate--CoA ligase [Rhodococcus chondri]|uniref:Acetoacetate--CoA ligase n=1 Tax=Rhodococcus chondri TaxID=3065941 RepID=A0ABU7JRG3_9NOCA|nr:acetoacetate--CoA ligase [Rhodococcus sp. CC-R104]MEE2032332.1 acetoacetate--CoA ligase [Rhodococcus sp. CC-R104]